jgi:hypothetical protein
MIGWIVKLRSQKQGPDSVVKKYVENTTSGGIFHKSLFEKKTVY